MAGAIALAWGSGAAARRSPRPDQLVFAGIPWGTPAESLTFRFAANGFKAVHGRSPDGMFVATGKFYERWSTLEAQTDDRQRLARIIITIEPKAPDDRDPGAGARAYRTWQEMHGTYGDIVGSLQQKYGPRDQAIEKFDFPYDFDGADQDKALADRKATIRSTWRAQDGDALTVEMVRTMAVQLTWDSAGWLAYQRRIRERHAKSL